MKKKLFSLFLMFAVVLQCSITAFAADTQNALPYEQYCDKTTQVGNSALSVINDQRISNYYEGIQVATGFEPVSATRQTVYVIDTLDSAGNVVESRLMTNQEVSEYNARLSAGQTRANTWVGEDGEDHQGGKLSIYLVVYKDSSRNYYAYGTADWENGVYHGGVNGPSAGYDFIALTWGGGGELKNSSSSDRSISGEYQYDQGAISFSRAQSDTYCGYCWQFDDTKGAYFADYIDSSAFCPIWQNGNHYRSAERSNISRLRRVDVIQRRAFGSFRLARCAPALDGAVASCCNPLYTRCNFMDPFSQER